MEKKMEMTWKLGLYRVIIKRYSILMGFPTLFPFTNPLLDQCCSKISTADAGLLRENLEKCSIADCGLVEEAMRLGLRV